MASLKFSKAALLALQAPEAGKRLTIYDTKVPKLALRMTATGTRTFYVVKRTGASMAWVKLGVFPDMTVEQAQKEAQRVLGEFASGANPAKARRAFKAEKTLSAFFTEYGTRHGAKKRAWRDDQQRFRDYLEKPLGKLKLSEITRGMIASALSDAEKAGRSVATVRLIRALASGIFAKAVEWGHLETNPAQGVKVSGAKVTRDRFLQSGELPRFFAAVAEESDLIRDYVLLSLLTGARRSNALAMHWREIDLEGGAWRIPRTKNDDPQTVTLAPEAIAILRARKPATAGGFVFPSDSESGHLEAPAKGWKRILDRDELAQLVALIEEAGGTIEPKRNPKTGAEVYESVASKLIRARKVAEGLKLNTEGLRITDLRIHDLRRTLGSWQARTGASMAIIGKSLNHKSQQATAIYARLDLDPVRQSVNTATAAMMEAAGLKQGADVVPMKKGKTSA